MTAQNSFWAGKRVLVTGGAGFIGSHLVEALSQLGADVRVVDSFENGSKANIESALDNIELIRSDLTDFDKCLQACEDVEIVLSLAAKVAGVAYNSEHPADMFRKNVRIGMNMLEAARLTNVERFLNVSSACVYRRNSPVPTTEDEGFVDDPEPSNLGYGWAKRVLELQARLYSQEYGMHVISVRPFNSYGPRDHFDIESGHVIPSLIKKVMDGDNPLIVWGDGSQTRSFIYVDDTVRGMILATERSVAEPVNIGSAEEISIANLARLIISLTNSKTEVRFDTSKPSGQPRRCPDVTSAKSRLGFEAVVSLNEGLRETINWYTGEINRVPIKAI
jgi:GDP-L-fucose synthase